MNKLNVKVMVGQTWVNNTNHVEVELTSREGNVVTWDSVDRSHSGTIFDGLIHTRFTFVPANDLEWCAVNCDEWYDGMNYLAKHKNKKAWYSYGDNVKNKYTKQQWNEMRVHLGLEEDDMKIYDIPNNAIFCPKPVVNEEGVSMSGHLTGANLKEMTDELAVNDKPVYTQAMADLGELPTVGFELPFYWEFYEGSQFKFLNQQLGWEVDDELEVIKIAEDDEGEQVAIVFNKETDILNCASIRCNSFFIKPKSEADKLADEISDVFNESIRGGVNTDHSVKMLMESFNITRKDSDNGRSTHSN